MLVFRGYNGQSGGMMPPNGLIMIRCIDTKNIKNIIPWDRLLGHISTEGYSSFIKGSKDFVS